MNSTTNALPVNFETFGEARRAGFMRAKAIKDAGGRIAGTFCTYTPNEIFDAAGIYTVSLCGTSDETIPDAERDLPKNLCPLIKSSYGFAVSDKCPYTYFSDIIIGETTCDGKKKMYEMLGELKDVFILQLPQRQDLPGMLDMWTAELHRLIETLEQKFDITITDEALRQAVRKRNHLRRATGDLLSLGALTPPAAYMKDLFQVTNSTGFSFVLGGNTDVLEEATSRIKAAYETGSRPVPAASKRILVTGCPIGGVLDKTIGTIERNGGVVVCLENCNGTKQAENLIDEDADDIVRAIARRYLDIGCAVMSPNPHRIEEIRALSKEYQIDGIVDIVLAFCQPYGIETRQIGKAARELGLPYIAIETDYSGTDRGQLETRLAAFLEMME